MEFTISLKTKIHKACLDFVDLRINNFLSSYNSSVESGNTDSKSSAGDKHETGKAMAQLEQEKAAYQLAEARVLKNILEKINFDQKHKVIAEGSLVNTNNGLFYIAIGIGKLEVENNKVVIISSQSPLGKCMMGQQKGTTICYNNLNYSIRNIV